MLLLFQCERSADFLDSVLGRAEQLDHLRIGQMRVVAKQESDRIRPVIALGDRGVAAAFAFFWSVDQPAATI